MGVRQCLQQVVELPPKHVTCWTDKRIVFPTTGGINKTGGLLGVSTNLWDKVGHFDCEVCLLFTKG